MCPPTFEIADTQGSNPDPIDIALAWNDGDPRATIGMLLDDCRHLRLQLALAEAGMSPLPNDWPLLLPEEAQRAAAQ